jgi:hypothetical protein
VERAQDTIAYLAATRPRPTTRWEEAGDLFTLAVDAAPGDRWPDFLAERAEVLKRSLAAAGPGDLQAENFNPDAPLPGLGADPQDQLIPVDPLRNPEPALPLVRPLEIDELIRAMPKHEAIPPKIEEPRADPFVAPLPPLVQRGGRSRGR